MTRKYSYDALSALWMLVNHGMTFENTKGGIIINEGILRIAVKNESDMPFYPDARGIALLNPIDGDDFEDDWDGFIRRVIPDDAARTIGKRILGHFVTLSHAIEVGGDIVKRGDVNFIMPQEISDDGK